MGVGARTAERASRRYLPSAREGEQRTAFAVTQFAPGAECVRQSRPEATGIDVAVGLTVTKVLWVAFRLIVCSTKVGSGAGHETGATVGCARLLNSWTPFFLQLRLV